MAITDGLQYSQSIIIGLIVSFLLAKLFSIVFSSTDDNFTSTLTNPNNDVVSKNLLADENNNNNNNNINTVVSCGNTNDDDDDDWEGVETTELDEAFCKATEFVASVAADRSVNKVSNDLRLKLYGLYKVGTDGVCCVPQPSAIKITARAKWNAWHKLGAMSQEEAMQKYLEIITELYPNWADGSTSMRSGGGNNETSCKDTKPMGPDPSSFVHKEEFELDAIHDFPREEMPLHSAVDRDQTDVAEILLSGNADINSKDNEGQTSLHHAAAGEPDDIDVKKNTATGIQDDDDDADDDGTVYPSDLSHSEWHSVEH